MKLSKFQKVESISNAVGILFGVPLLLIFVSQAVRFTPAAIKALPYLAFFVALGFVAASRIVNARLLAPLRNCLEKGKTDRPT
ncbi:MAG: hypothetical protein QME74_10585, partial [Candidatus Edwardsbacteria bacterium]|nr:hypothetical protein [Candidatus Edwardsbacteria bacterium]